MQNSTIDDYNYQNLMVEENYIESNISLPPGSMAVTESDIKDMKSILERFNDAATEIAHNVAQEVLNEKEYRTDPLIKEAILTRSTDNGVQIGKWEIRIVVEELQSGKEKKRYTIAHNKNNMVIAEDIVLYETAYGVVKLLNRGKSMTNPEIKEILKLEEKYNELRSEAVNFKKRSINFYKKREEQSAQIFENKFENSKSLAHMTHKKIKKIVENIR